MSHSPIRSVCLFLFLLLSSSFNVFAQSYSGLNWYFGNNNNSFRFTRPNFTPERLSSIQPLGTGMSAVATDPVTGTVLFYTDGLTVYEATGNVMFNGNIASGAALSQGIAICAVPGNAGQYFIFSQDPAGNLLATTVDMNATGNATFPEPSRGEVTGTVSAAGLTNLSQGMIIIPNDTKETFWLITQVDGSDAYNVSEINSAGLQPPVTYNIGSALSAGNLSFNQATRAIAVASPATDLQIINIDRATGALTAGITIGGFNSAYDTEWSNNGQLLYVSGNFGGDEVLAQVDLSAIPTPTIELVNTANTLTNSYGLQMAPDSAIYHLYENGAGNFLVGRINAPDTTASQVLYEARAFQNTNFNGQQFPTFLAEINPTFSADFTYSGTCQNEETFFYPTIDPRADSVSWSFGDDGSSSQLAPTHTYQEANTFDVTLTAYLNGDSATVTHPITIIAFEIQITLRSDTTFCLIDYPASDYSPNGNGTASVEAQISGSPTSIIWSNGDTGNTLTPDSSGYYYVIATDGSGCSTHAGITVNTYGEDKQRSNVWYFGNNAGIDFNSGTAEPIPFGDLAVFDGGNQLTTPEGCTIYCDRNGEPLFYTDGVDVYDQEGNLLTPTDKLGGDQGSTQSALIVPFPDDETLFYIFTTQEVYGDGTYDLQYAVYDRKDESNNTLGAMVYNANNELITTLATSVTERLTGTENWVIVHEYGNDNFKAFPIQGDGIGSPVISNVGPTHNSERKSRGYMTLSGSGLLAVAYSEDDNNNFVDLLQFTDSTGVIEERILLEINNPKDVLNPSSPNASGQVYGVSFSPDGSNLFATVQGSPSHIFRWKSRHYYISEHHHSNRVYS
ncbi:PKD domain-containing protein [Fulvivirga maritima]|uniref:PKD domain-containing protein n=1 Tax=Fulvivirga maritima TaxID=2904247 RepID=UPI001F1A43EA|nr:PKD domain-containing protein [Fulvivirga maritima]UII26995.1 PKD domain-containing protein [Fulvivirga maritima]